MAKFTSTHAKCLRMLITAFDRCYLPPCEGKEAMQLASAVQLAAQMAKQIEDDLKPKSPSIPTMSVDEVKGLGNVREEKKKTRSKAKKKV